MTSPAPRGDLTRRVTATANIKVVTLPNGAVLDKEGEYADLTESEYKKVPTSLFQGGSPQLTVASRASDENADIVSAATFTLTSAVAAGATPTKAEFDALRADLVTLTNRLKAL